MPQVAEDAYKSTTSVSDQFSKSFSSTVKDVGSAVDGFLKSAPSSIGEALNNVGKAASALGAVGLSAAGSVSQALNQLSALGTYTKFKDNFNPPSKLRDIPPEEIDRSKGRYSGNLTYPSDLGEYYILFEFKSYKRIAPITEFKELTEATIALPIPTNLQEQFQMQYADKALGAAGAIEEKAREKLAGQTFSNAQAAGEAIGGTISEFAGTTDTLLYGARSLAGISDSIGGAIDTATGAVLNPFQSLVFQGVNLRSHSFSYRFSPNSESESNKLKEIIYQFKKRMHPQKTSSSLFLQFPDIVDIKFGKEKDSPYTFATCFLESMSVNYAPQGTPAFFASSSNPVETEITLNFKEIKPLTRDDIKAPTQPTYY